MEKRFIVFLVASLTIVVGYGAIRSLLLPPPEQVARLDAPAGDDEESVEGSEEAIDQAAQPEIDENETSGDQQPEAPAAIEEQPTEPGDASAAASSKSASETGGETTGGETTGAPALVNGSDDADASSSQAPQWFSFGSYEPRLGAPLLVTFTSRGGAVERVELTERTDRGRLRYLNLDDNSGYLGHLALTVDDDTGGCRVNVVGDATPAAKAAASHSGTPPGLMVGDVILRVDDMLLQLPTQLEDLLHRTRPGDAIELTVLRVVGGEPMPLDFTATLDVRPLQLIRPGPSFSEAGQGNQSSMLLSLVGLGEKRVDPGEVELQSIDSLRDAIWRRVPQDDPTVVEFRYSLALSPGGGESAASAAALEIVKRFRLGTRAAWETLAESESPYHLDLEIEFHNQTADVQDLVYRLDGPNGLPLEGWWYSNKIHPDLFYVAGARDIVWEFNSGGFNLLGAPAILKAAQKKPNLPQTVLFAEDKSRLDRQLEYAGVDSQYFLAAFIPDLRPDGTPAPFDRAAAYAIGDLDAIPRGAQKTTNVSFHIDSAPLRIAPGETYEQKFVVYAGPKIAPVLTAYGLEHTIYYGWFAPVSRFLAHVLHFFYHIVFNYGLAIVMLTILVRSCMFPISRKAAKNAAMMQELAPEMKQIADKYKNDMEKRGRAQQELFKKHNYNPFSGCWLMFLQLPIFIGLYRCLSVDIELRQAALIPGIQWASNLAGPDKLFEWRNLFGLSIFTEIGMLGPYFNILPIFTICLFLVHQKLFTPPATDEQTRLQMTMMKYMTVFIGVMFFKVPAGLCLYFIASSLWGIAERKLLPKSKAQAAAQKTTTKQVATSRDPSTRTRPAANGSGDKSKGTARVKRRKRR